MSVCSGVPIEPPSQTKLLDACMDVPGVLMAGVPGAGGFDAIFVVVVGGRVESSLGLSAREGDADGMVIGVSMVEEDVVECGLRGRLGVERIWSKWNEDGVRVGPLLCEESSEGVLKQ
jgi:hypothetical protein